jgi:hypothetical protein
MPPGKQGDHGDPFRCRGELGPGGAADGPGAESQDEYLGGDALADVGDVHTVTRGVVTAVVVREEHGVAPLRQGGWRLRWELGSGTARVA